MQKKIVKKRKKIVRRRQNEEREAKISEKFYKKEG